MPRANFLFELVKLVRLLVTPEGAEKLFLKYASIDPLVVMLYLGAVESVCAKLVLKIKNRIAMNEIFFNIVIDFNF
jgi:hypothetical protein